MQPEFDLVIVGGGMVGAALAHVLPSDYKIALIDAASPNALDPRLIALNHNSYSLFKNLKLWDLLKNDAEKISTVHVSTQGRFGTTVIKAEEVNLDVLGYMVPAHKINAALYQKFPEHITLLQPAKLVNLIQTENDVTLEVSIKGESQFIKTKKIIAADGTHSSVRKILELQTDEIHYDQQAIVNIVDLTRPHHNIAYERFLKTGAIAMLPLPQNSVACIWSDATQKITALMQLDDEQYLNELQKHFGFRLGKLQKIRQRFVFPLQYISVKENLHGNVFLMGNAAHTIHPIAAQGLNLALYEVATIAEHHKELFSDPISFCEKITTPQYHRLAKKFSHNLNQIFLTDFFLLNTAKQLALMSIDIFTVLKKSFARQIMGKAQRAPRLLQ